MTNVRRIGSALAAGGALAAIALLAPAPAHARETAAQKLFREQLLADRSVARDVKTRLRKGGFVDRRVLFADLTGEGRDDAVVLVHSGGSAGRIAAFVFSAGDGEELRIVFRDQRLYRASARVLRAPRSGGLRSFVVSVPRHRPGDELCCPRAVEETERRWSERRERFALVERRTIERAVAG